MTRYKAALFAPDGEYVTDHPRATIAAVQEALADQGSRWYFYPFHVVIVDHGPTSDRQRVIDAAEPFEDLRGVTLRTFARTIAATPEPTLRAILEG